MLIEDEHHCSVLTPNGLRTGRAIRYFASRQKPERDDLWSVWVTCSHASKASYRQVTDKTCTLNRAKSSPASRKQQVPCQNMDPCCVLPTWWLLRGGCTRSLSEHGRETPLRQWYFVLRRGRVGRCQVCKTQHKAKHLLNTLLGKAETNPAAQKRPFSVPKLQKGTVTGRNPDVPYKTQIQSRI
jgi:hypothetical protein